MSDSKYYAVTAMCGHVGRNNYVEKTFAIKASNGKEAAEKGRWLPRVKHHNKHAIISVIEITENEFYDLREENNHDSYFFCKNIQEQKLLCADLNIKSLPSIDYDNHDHVIRATYQSKRKKADDEILKNYLNECCFYDDYEDFEDYEY